MDRQARKAAAAAYKERKPAFGVYAVVCDATGEAWVGRSRHLDTQQNGLWFGLRQASSPFPSLQAAWTLHGEREFRFEELERLREDFPEYGRLDELKKRQALWQGEASLRRAVMSPNDDRATARLAPAPPRVIGGGCRPWPYCSPPLCGPGSRTRWRAAVRSSPCRR